MHEESAAGILIVDDHPAVRIGLKNLISSRAGWFICGEAADGEQAVALATALKPAVIVMDISMPRMDGLEATRQIRQRLPNAEILIVSQHDADHVVAEAQKAGARGFVVKSHLSADLLPAVEAAMLHSSRISAPVAKAWQEAISATNPRPVANLGDPGPHDDLDLMSGGGEMGSLMRRHDWSQTPFGPVSKWPQSLRTAVRICLDSRFPIVIFWGGELRLLYNDAYLPALGTTKHPRALGARGIDIWTEIWDTIGPMLEGVMRTGHATWESDQLLLFDRNGYLEETYWTYSYSAIRLQSGDVGGVFTAVHEVTDRVLTARRLKTLREVADQVVQAKSATDACSLAMQSIVHNPTDCPYAAIFLLEGTNATRVASSFEADPQIPARIDLAEQDAWGLREAMQAHSVQVVTVENPELLPAAPFGARCKEAISIPILGPLRDTIAVLVVGVSPYRALDGAYREFLESLARNLAANINNARAYDEERKRAEALAELDRAKTAFFSNVSHEFRTPLTLMLGPLEDTLAEREGIAAPQRQRLEVAHRNSLRLLKLVNTLLDFSRLEAGRAQASYVATDLAALTTELASVFRSAAERAGLKLIVKSVPIGEPVYVDREMWEKIVFNLLSNAFKFTFKGEIEISLRRAGDRVELSVRDTGTGIPVQELPHLFERFYRVRGAQGRTFEGSGIGLALVQELVKLHGGTVGVKSELHQGSEFTVSLPLGKEHLPADRIDAERTLTSTSVRGEAYVQEALRWLPGGGASDEFGAESLLGADAGEARDGTDSRARILLADDNADMRDYVQRLLRETYEVIAVGDGEAALEKARAERPDLILSDVMMPRRDGFGLLQAIRADESLRDVPVILLSARAGEESRIEGAQAGADDYLVKPFSARELMARVRSHLSIAEVRKQAAEQGAKSRAEAEREQDRLRAILDAIPVPVYCTDAEGYLTYFNQAAVEFAGRMPELGRDRWCVAEKLYRPDGTALNPEDSWMAAAIREGRTIRGQEVIAEKRDGTRRWFMPLPTPVRNVEGVVTGGINVLLDITERKNNEQATHHLAAIVESSDDAIVSKSLNGIITSWNKSAERIFGYTAAEAIGQHITLIIPEDRHQEETGILARLRRGERVDHFETVRRRKDGTLLDISLTISPVRDASGRVVGASKVARDITAQKRAERELESAAREQQALFRLADSLHRSTNLEQVYEAAFDAITSALGCRRSAILLFDRGGVMRFAAWRDLSDSYRRAVEGHSPWKAGEKDPQPVFVNDVRDAALDDSVKNAVETEGIGAMAFIPLISEGRLMGKFMLYFDQRRGFSGHEAELSIAIARQLAFAIDRRHAEERERQMSAEAMAANAKFRAVFEQTTVFAGIMTMEGILIDTNRLSLEACGYGGPEVLGLPFWETPWWRNFPESQRKIQAATPLVARGIPYRETLKYSRADGSERILDFSLHPIVDDKGKILFLHTTGVDVTALKQAEESYQRLVETLDGEVRARTRELEERNADVLRQSEQLRELSWKLLSAQDEERRHVARELHDSAGQTLTVLGMSLAQFVQTAGRHAPELVGEAEKIEETVQQLHKEIRTTSYLLHPPLLDENGLASALAWYVEGLAERSDLALDLKMDKDFGRLPREMELVVFRLVQECVTNIHRHSGSKTATIGVARAQGEVVVEVQDQGRGMTPEKLLEIQSRGSGVGIRGMRERLRQFGGRLEIESGASGTQVRASIPLLKKEAEETGAEPLRAAV